MNSYFPQPVIRCAGHFLDLSTPKIMGILNVTPDSFSDGGRFNSIDAALVQAERMLQEGAALIDVGGESTRPGALPISENEELDRVAPVVERLVKDYNAVVSLDTSSPVVMRECAKLGAALINDVRSLTRPGALAAARDTDMAVCIMHMNGEPQVMQLAPHYDRPIEQAVVEYLADRVDVCVDAGISRERLLIDPGFGFGKTLEHNLRLLQEMASLQGLALPILVGTSRKGMIGKILADEQGASREIGEHGEGRLYGGLALTAMAVERGARIIRTHDVASTRDAVALTWAVVSMDTSV